MSRAKVAREKSRTTLEKPLISRTFRPLQRAEVKKRGKWVALGHRNWPPPVLLVPTSRVLRSESSWRMDDWPVTVHSVEDPEITLGFEHAWIFNLQSRVYLDLYKVDTHKKEVEIAHDQFPLSDYIAVGGRLRACLLQTRHLQTEMCL